MGRLGMGAVKFVAVVCALAVSLPYCAQAASTGQIALRGVVSQQAMIGINRSAQLGSTGAVVPGAASLIAVDFRPSSGGESVAVFHLSRLANSSSGFVVTL